MFGGSSWARYRCFGHRCAQLSLTSVLCLRAAHAGHAQVSRPMGKARVIAGGCGRWRCHGHRSPIGAWRSGGTPISGAPPLRYWPVSDLRGWHIVRRGCPAPSLRPPWMPARPLCRWRGRRADLLFVVPSALRHEVAQVLPGWQSGGRCRAGGPMLGSSSMPSRRSGSRRSGWPGRMRRASHNRQARFGGCAPRLVVPSITSFQERGRWRISCATALAAMSPAQLW